MLNFITGMRFFPPTKALMITTFLDFTWLADSTVLFLSSDLCLTKMHRMVEIRDPYHPGLIQSFTGAKKAVPIQLFTR
jgi:hypothetical protein